MSQPTSRSRRVRDERGVSTVELAMYMPLLMIAILLTVQFSLVYLGNQAASGAAREAARVARVTGDATQGRAAGERLVATIGSGVLENAVVAVRPAGVQEMQAVVSGQAQGLLPFLDPPRVSETVQGPIERFVPDS
jgi:Flp pilus assembly protein TadG